MKTVDRVRQWLGINDDLRNVAKDIEVMSHDIQKLNGDIFGIFHSLPFVAAVLTMTAADAAKFVNPNMEENSLISILTSIIIAARQGQSSLQVFGKLDPKIRAALEKRHFKVEEVSGSNNSTGLFILWT